MKKILVTGGDGRFASELKKIKTNIKFIYLNKKRLDICNFKSIIKAIKKYKPKTILHLAGLSRPMDIHESNISKSISINVIGTANLVMACSMYKIKIILIEKNKSDIIFAILKLEEKFIFLFIIKLLTLLFYLKLLLKLNA